MWKAKSRKLISDGVQIRKGGSDKKSKINKPGGLLFGTREYIINWLRKGPPNFCQIISENQKGLGFSYF